jgi:N-acyl-D-aspartate/D-glutamate deacylase
LAKYVREEGVLSLEQAIHKMTALPARRIKLGSRGTLAQGMVADISIFDHLTVTDRDDWSSPHQYPTGFEYVIVGGTPVIDNGVQTGAFPGKVLKRGLP